MRRLLFTLLLSSGCTTQEVDPLGNWNVTLTWGAGTCGFVGADAVTFTITEAANGYLISGNPTATVTGTITCTDKDCKLSATEIEPIVGGTVSASYNLLLKADNTITGSGTIGFSDSQPCNHAFMVTGRRS